jgi:pyridoxine 5-phosphate synthase
LENGADQITIHLREDRRHIQDHDLPVVREATKKQKKLMNLEMGCHPEIIEMALIHKPDWVCLVPEKREERTTEGGLDLLDEKNFERVKQSCIRLKDSLKNIKISLFLEASEQTLKRVPQLGRGLVDAVEIHTGEYAHHFLRGMETSSFIHDFRQAKITLEKMDINCHAGHGLTLESVRPLIDEGLFEEYNIGHWIISEAVFMGLGSVVIDLKNLFQKGYYEDR